MHRLRPLLPPAALLMAALSCLIAAGPARAGQAPFGRIGTIQVPGNPLESFDIGFVNDRGIYVLSDRSNGGLDFFSASEDRFIGRVTGFERGAGPNGVLAVGRDEFWAGDGGSTVKVVNLRTRKVIASISTGGRRRADEMTYDPRDHLVAAVNNDDDPPFVTFISTRTRKVLGRLELTQATGGAEQPLWNPSSGYLYLSIPVLDHQKAHGAIAVIDPRSRRLVKLLPVTRCMPAGLVLGPHGDMLVACSDDAISAGFAARSFVINTSGKVIARIPIGGSDEAWSEPRAGLYLLAAVANPGGPVLGVVNARTNRLTAILPTGPHAHSVAADGRTGRVFVPIAPGGTQAGCARGCIAVFGPR